MWIIFIFLKYLNILIYKLEGIKLDRRIKEYILSNLEINLFLDLLEFELWNVILRLFLYK